MIPRASALPSTILAVPPSAVIVLESVLWKGVLWMSAAGSHTRVAPEGFKTSTRVFTSNVRQPSKVAPSVIRQPIFWEREAGGHGSHGAQKIPTVHRRII